MKRYQDDFKASIVKMHREEKRSIRSLSEEYGVSPAAIHNWVKGAKSVELEDGTEVTSKEFKQNIINLYKQGESAAQLAREYGIGYSTVHKWIQGQAKTQSGKSPDEIKAMEKRLASLSEENEILKNALGFLAQK
ncbi:transposase [Weissella paramesenteroides]